ncbi:hypothetical protein Dimus_025707 [Dionaea muscipula]
MTYSSFASIAAFHGPKARSPNPPQAFGQQTSYHATFDFLSSDLSIKQEFYRIYTSILLLLPGDMLLIAVLPPGADHSAAACCSAATHCVVVNCDVVLLLLVDVMLNLYCNSEFIFC